MQFYYRQNLNFLKKNMMKKSILLALLALLAFALFACSDSKTSSSKPDVPKKEKKAKKKPKANKGIGETKKVTLNDPLDEAMAERGEGIYELKCAACHKLTAKRVVGPGWEGLTKKRTPEWIMNMITNVDVIWLKILPLKNYLRNV